MPLDVEKIARLRKKLGLTFAEASRRAGLGSAGKWCDVERGRRKNLTIATLEAMAKVLGVKAKDLLK